MQAIAKAENETDSVVSFNDTDNDLNLENEKEKKGGCVGCLRDNLFMIVILLGVVVGFGIGFGVRQLNPSPVAITWIAMPGDLYIRLLQLTILPLIASNLIVVISSLDPREQGLSSLVTVAYIIGFNFAGAAIGTAFATCTPVGVAFMIAAAILNVSDIKAAFAGLGMFVLTVTVALGVLFFLCIILYGAVALRNPFCLLRFITKSWFISFATTSPIVSLAEMFDGCDQYGVDQSISRFACPLMTALKADGPAVFISSAAVFVAQTESAGSSPGTLVIIWILTAVSALAIPHIPSASIIITMTILSSANVPTANTAYLYAVDWLL
ncbi:unnamed protein product [Dibothriocephalus latus]|uniref:Amino acid transporter n=1 Tax=Dibothriocephalus latus TaxID=60516 RepID=A0A3P6TGR3_DIBLA|nr:unnamed protein product [Dibothriocephalus latus]